MATPFYYRVFTSVERNIWADEIERFVEESNVGLSVIGIVDEDDAEKLDAEPVELLLCDEDESEVATLVYDRLDTSDILAEEIAEFQEVIQGMFPECNRSWVADKLAHSTGCYCFTVFDAGLLNDNWDRLATLAEWLRDETNGIEQSDGGQITNEQGAVALVTPFEDESEDEEDDSNDEDFEEFDEEFDDDDDEFEEEGDDVEAVDSDEWDSDDYESGEFDDEEEDGCSSDEFNEEVDSSEEYDEDDSSFEDESEDEDDSEEDVDDSELEDEEESEDFVAVIRVGDRWIEKQVDSEESLEEFMRGEV